MRVKLLYASHSYGSDCDCVITNGIKETDWDEIPDKDYSELVAAVSHHNRNYNSTERLIVVRYPTIEEKKLVEPKLIASKYLEFVRKREIQSKKEKLDKEKKKEESRKKRELKQLEDLKKKYEEANSASQ